MDMSISVPTTSATGARPTTRAPRPAPLRRRLTPAELDAHMEESARAHITRLANSTPAERAVRLRAWRDAWRLFFEDAARRYLDI